MARRILIADDSAVFRELEAKTLKARGYEVVQATNGAEALRLTVEQRPDLILLDVQMPVMDGVQVLAALKKNQATAKIPIIVVTTIGREHDREIFMKGGANDFVAKPIEGRVLLERIRALLGE